MSGSYIIEQPFNAVNRGEIWNACALVLLDKFIFASLLLLLIWMTNMSPIPTKKNSSTELFVTSDYLDVIKYFFSKKEKKG